MANKNRDIFFAEAINEALVLSMKKMKIMLQPLESKKLFLNFMME